MWALLLEKTHPQLATDVIYVAGDRVVTDPLCKPFSMGRNLFCVHSKKRMDDQPELKAEKQRTNRRTVVEMGKALREVRVLLASADISSRGVMDAFHMLSQRNDAQHKIDLAEPFSQDSWTHELISHSLLAPLRKMCTWCCALRYCGHACVRPFPATCVQHALICFVDFTTKCSRG